MTKIQFSGFSSFALRFSICLLKLKKSTCLPKNAKLLKKGRFSVREEQKMTESGTYTMPFFFCTFISFFFFKYSLLYNIFIKPKIFMYDPDFYSFFISMVVTYFLVVCQVNFLIRM